MDNRTVLKEGMKAARNLIKKSMVDMLERTSASVLEDALNKREFTSFTGNTVTSYTTAVIDDGRIIGGSIVSSGKFMPKPVRSKVGYGETVYLKEPYEGKGRSIKGSVQIADGDGQHLAEQLVREHGSKGNFTMVITTGTEYSAYLETQRNVNVLSDTGLIMDQLFEQNITKL